MTQLIFVLSSARLTTIVCLEVGLLSGNPTLEVRFTEGLDEIRRILFFCPVF